MLFDIYFIISPIKDLIGWDMIQLLKQLIYVVLILRNVKHLWQTGLSFVTNKTA